MNEKQGWSHDNNKVDKQPSFQKASYSDRISWFLLTEQGIKTAFIFY